MLVTQLPAIRFGLNRYGFQYFFTPDQKAKEIPLFTRGHPGGVLQGILQGILRGILWGILRGILHGIPQGILWGILRGIPSGLSWASRGLSWAKCVVTRGSSSRSPCWSLTPPHIQYDHALTIGQNRATPTGHWAILRAQNNTQTF